MVTTEKPRCIKRVYDAIKESHIAVLAARTGVGKTTFALDMATAFACDKKVLFFTVVEEMGRMVSSLKQHMDDKQLINISILAEEKLNLETIQKNMLKENPGIAIIDYLQCFEVEDEKSVKAIMCCLKELAQEARAPIVVLSQLLRQADARERPIPCTDDMPQHRAIIPFADTILLLYCDYSCSTMKRWCIVEKTPSGKIGKIPLNWDSEIGAFANLRKYE